MSDPLMFHRLLLRLEEQVSEIKSLYSRMRNETDNWQQEDIQRAIRMLDDGIRKTKEDIRRQVQDEQISQRDKKSKFYK